MTRAAFDVGWQGAGRRGTRPGGTGSHSVGSHGTDPDAGPAVGRGAVERPAAGRAAPVDTALRTLAAVGLDELVGRAALQTRVDRKYLVPTGTLVALLGEISSVASVLDIDGRRRHRYSSVYFDTPDLLCFREHRQGRRRRFKVRSRSYLDSGECLLEVKTVGPRDATVKRRMDYRPSQAAQLTDTGLAFVADALQHHSAVPVLQPSLVTDYHRTTLLDRAAGSRLTIDTGLHFTAPHRSVAAPPDTVVIETKSPGAPGRADRVLCHLGARPVSVSKYCAGIALLHPELSANRWYRVLRQHFGA